MPFKSKRLIPKPHLKDLFPAQPHRPDGGGGCSVHSRGASGLRPRGYDAHFPVIVKSGINEEQRQIDFIFNYSADEEQVTVPVKGTELLGGKTVAAGEQMTLQPWAVKIIEEQ